MINRAGFAQIFGHEPAIGMEHFSVAQLNRRAGWTFDFEADNAGEILAEVKNVNAIRRRRDGHGFDFFGRAHRHARKRFELRRTFEAQINWPAFDFHRAAGFILVAKFVKRRRHAAVFLREDRLFPLAVIESWLVPAAQRMDWWDSIAPESWLGPARRFFARIVKLAHQ